MCLRDFCAKSTHERGRARRGARELGRKTTPSMRTQLNVMQSTLPETRRRRNRTFEKVVDMDIL